MTISGIFLFLGALDDNIGNSDRFSWRGVLPRLTKQYIDDDDVGFKENPLSVKGI